jgi:hypothetical protein
VRLPRVHERLPDTRPRLPREGPGTPHERVSPLDLRGSTLARVRDLPPSDDALSRDGERRPRLRIFPIGKGEALSRVRGR